MFASRAFADAVSLAMVSAGQRAGIAAVSVVPSANRVSNLLPTVGRPNMTEDPRIQQLLDELFETNSSPEVVCKSCPELLPVVRARWRRMRRLEADLEAIFPSSAESIPLKPEWVGLPEISGYEVESVLGRGGTGIVFRARHMRLDRWVALKVLLAGAYDGQRERERFRRAAEAAARLRHPNVVQIYDVGDVDGRPYFTMELVDGQSLAQRIAGMPQPALQAAQLVATLAGAIEAAHAVGIVHRDLKPANVLLTTEGTPKVSDFGLAHSQEDSAGPTQSGVPVGTPGYMAPEQAAGLSEASGPATDVYALGAILYEMLTGRPPFRADSPIETQRQVIALDPAAPSRLNARVPRDVETICLKCLHTDRRRRYGSAAELADDLVRFQRGEPILARRAGVVERVIKWFKHNLSIRKSPSGQGGRA